MKAITIYDTSISTRNVGDEIIMDSVNKELSRIFYKRQIFRVPTHNYLTLGSYKCLRESEMSIVGGSNLLSSNMPFYQQWNVTPLDLLFSGEVILLGVGWWQYQKSPNIYTKFILNKMLSKKFIHSVRDGYTEKQLNNIGIKNVINTSCPTMWGLTKEHCENIPPNKSNNVIFTLTDYNQSPDSDFEILKILDSEYDKVGVWLQGSKDYEYLKSLNADHLVDEIIPARLASFDEAISAADTEYVGTRLHAGIRSLQLKKRSLVLAVDNRGIEKKRDYNLHVINREDMSGLRLMISKKRKTELNIDFNRIDKWRSQFY
ncbi:MAG: polysaccharide pyruvyl transferase family protein [Gammaproteobacteria bacterium]|nr:polysaccharide pyruvyl transferase family protein [Gammaproteobacteria bacterium]